MGEETLAITQSNKQANNVLEEFALTGAWQATDRNEFGIIYSRGDDELVIEKRGDRQWAIVKRDKVKTP